MRVGPGPMTSEQHHIRCSLHRVFQEFWRVRRIECALSAVRAQEIWLRAGPLLAHLVQRRQPKRDDPR